MDLYDIKIVRSLPYQISIPSILRFEPKQRPFILFPISLMTSQRGDFIRFVSQKLPLLKQMNENFKLLVGGWHATGAPEDVLDIGADHVITGEAEGIFAQLLIDLYKNPEKLPKVINASNPPDLNQYPPFSEKYRVFCPIEISRGCPFRCKFCQTGHQFPIMRHASIENIVKWTDRAVKIHYKRVWFATSNAFAYGSHNGGGTNPQMVEKLLRSIKDIPKLDEVYFGSFPSEVRPEFVTKDMMEAVHPYINNKFFTLGAQSASDELLKRIWRSHTFQNVLDATDRILDYGYGVDIDFIFGLPEEKEEDIQLTMDFFNEVLRSAKRIRIHTHAFMPLPGTPYQYEPVGVITEDLEKMLGLLASRNKAFGSHKKQARGLI
jgi:B12-binding domain/radical SAM domain protein